MLTGLDQRIFEAARAAHTLGAQLLLCPSAFSSSRSSAFFQSCAFMRCQEQPVFAVSAWLTGDFMDLPFRAISGIYAPFSASKLGNGHHHADRAPRRQRHTRSRVDLERLSQDPDLYISDINPAVEEMAQREYGLARQTPVEEDSGDEEENDAAQQQQMEEAAVTDEAMEEAFESGHPPRAGLAC